MSREVMQQALEALLWQAHAKPAHNPSIVNDAITALRAALEEPEPEPVAWMYDWTTSEGEFIKDWTTSEAETLRDTEPTIISNVRPLYTHPPQRKPLTDEEIDDIWNRYCDEMGEASINDAYDIARAIEAAHGIKQEDV